MYVEGISSLSDLKGGSKRKTVDLENGVNGANGMDDSDDEEDSDFLAVKEKKDQNEEALTRTGRLFGGLVLDVRRKLPW